MDKAYLDEKNLTTDWIFDILLRNEYIDTDFGYLFEVEGYPYILTYQENFITARQLADEGMNKDYYNAEVFSMRMESAIAEINECADENQRVLLLNISIVFGAYGRQVITELYYED